jgi:hypothetical protein
MVIRLLTGSTLVGVRQGLQAGLRERRHTDKKEEDSKKDNKKRAKASKSKKSSGNMRRNKLWCKSREEESWKKEEFPTEREILLQDAIMRIPS